MASALGMVRVLVSELHWRQRLCLQSQMIFWLLSPEEIKVLGDYFHICGRYLKKGKPVAALEHLLVEITRDPVAAFARLGMVSQVEMLLGQDLHYRGTALTQAAFHGSLEIVELLLEPPRQHALHALNSALENGAKEGHLAVVQRLYQAGGQGLDNALYFAARGDHQPTVEFLLSVGASDFKGALKGAALEGSLPLMRRFLELGAKVNREVLRMAAMSKNPQAAALVLSWPHWSRKHDSKKITAEAACFSRSSATAALFLEAGAHNYKDIISKALERGNLETAQFVTPYEPVDSYERLAVYAAFYTGTRSYIEYLWDRTPIDPNKILKAAIKGSSVDNVRLALSRGASNLNSCLVIKSRIGKKDLQILRMLLEAGADDLDPALIKAASEGHSKVVQILVEGGAIAYDAALVAAARTNKGVEVMALMLDLGARAYKEALRAVSGYLNLEAALLKLLRDKGLVSAHYRELEPELVLDLQNRGLLP